MKRKLKSLRHFLELIPLLPLLGIFRILPFSWCMHAADKLSPLIAALFPIRKGIVIRNIRQAFPQKGKREIKKLTRETYRNFLLFTVEFLFLAQKKKERLVDQTDSAPSYIEESQGNKPSYPCITEIEGEQYFHEVGGGKKGYLILTAHLGNWELMGAIFAGRGVPLSVLAKPIHNLYLNRFINRVRKAKGMEVMSTRGTPMKAVLKALQSDRRVVFLADQDARKAGVFVDFFGKAASTFSGPALFSLRSGLPILPVFDVRTSLFSHKVIFLPPIYPPTNEVKQGKMDRDDAIRHITQQHVKKLEEIIRQYPNQYFWFHRRWKSQPV